MSGRTRLLTPLAVGAAVLAVSGLLVWGTTRGMTMLSPGPLNAQAKNQSLGGVGSHAQLGTACSPCHSTPWSSDTMAKRCVACHKDVTAQIEAKSGLHGILATAGSGETCRGCHTEHKGPLASLTVFDQSFPHEATGFSLKAHDRAIRSGRLTCADCHGQDLTQFSRSTCVSCHEQRNSGFMRQHVATFGEACVPCHDGVDRYGRDFDHNKLSFKLTGAHAKLGCSSCHSNQTTVAALKQTPQDCYSCHKKDDAHVGKFGQSCGQCHSANNWKDATFDHSKTSFPLVGAHAKLSCDRCHVGGQFAGTSTNCVSCHAEPAFHNGAFGAQSTQCALCHSAEAWSPAQFSLGHPAFPLDHGSREQTATCKTCHPTNVSSYTCFGCHRHTPAEVAAEHEGRSAAELQDCVRCHAGGRGGGD